MKAIIAKRKIYIISCLAAMCAAIGIVIVWRIRQFDKQESAEIAADLHTGIECSPEPSGPLIMQDGGEWEEIAELPEEECREFSSLQEINDFYREHWQEKLLAEGSIAGKEEIYSVSDDYYNTANLESAAGEDREMTITVTALDPEYRFWFYRTVLNFRYLDNKIIATQGEDYVCREINTLQDALDFPMGFSDPWKEEEAEAEKNWFRGDYVRKLGEVSVEYAKEHDVERYKTLLDPVTAAEDFLRLQGGSGEFIREHIYYGIVVYTFADGTKAHYHMCRSGDAWWPLYLLDRYDGAEEITAAAREISDLLESADAGMLCAGQEDNFLLLCEYPERDAALYGLSDGGGMILRVGDNVYPVYLPWDIGDSCYDLPDFYAGDFDDDGTWEYAIHCQDGRGTGVSTYALYVLDIADGKLRIREFSRRDWNSRLWERISYDYPDGILEIYESGNLIFQTDRVRNYLEEAKQEFLALSWGDIMDFEFRDGEWYLCADIGVCTKDWAVPHYEPSIMLSSPVGYSPEGDFTLGEISVWYEKNAIQ